MKRLLLLCLLLANSAFADSGFGPWPGAGSFIIAPPSIVGSCQTGAFPNGSAGNTATVNLTVSIAGDTIVVGAVALSTSGTVQTISVSDGGGSYTSDIQQQQINVASHYQQVGLYHLSAATATTHAIVATNTTPSGDAYGAIWACEVSGITGAAVTNSSSSASSTNPNSGSATPSSLNSIAFSVMSLNDIGTTENFCGTTAGSACSYTNVGKLTNGSSTSLQGSMDYLIQTGTMSAQNASYATFSDSNASATAIAIYPGYGGAAGNTTKFNPGHYVIPNARPNPVGGFSVVQTAINDMDTAFVSSSQHFMGVQIEPTWYQLETAAGGHYYFNPTDPNYTSSNIIDQTLAALATKSASRSAACSCTVDYKLIIYMDVFESLIPGAIATPPQAAPYGSGINTKSIAPDYVISAGCAYLNSFSTPLQSVALWRSACMNDYIALLNELGTVYDSNPHVEAIIPIYETGVNSSTVTDGTYTFSGFIAEISAMKSAMATSWLTTQKPLFVNYGFSINSGSMSNTQLDTWVTDWVTSVSPRSNNGFALGGPDILYQSDDGNPTPGDQISRGIIGSVSYLGKTGLVWEEQANAGVWNDQTSVGTESYAYGTLGATHEVWADIPSGQTSNPSGEWPAIVSALGAVSFRINGTRPTSYN